MKNPDDINNDTWTPDRANVQSLYDVLGSGVALALKSKVLIHFLGEALGPPCGTARRERRLRLLVDAALHSGVSVCANNTGYFRASSIEELMDYQARLQNTANGLLRKAQLVATLVPVAA